MFTARRKGRTSLAVWQGLAVAVPLLGAALQFQDASRPFNRELLGGRDCTAADQYRPAEEREKDYDALMHMLEGMAVELERTWGTRINSTLASAAGAPVMMTISEWHQVSLLQNFFAHARKVAAEETLAVANFALDVRSHQACQEAAAAEKNAGSGASLKIMCINLTGWLPTEMEGWHGGSTIGNCYYEIICWAKPPLVLAAVKAAPQGVLVIDIDVVLRHNLLSWVQNHSHDGEVMMTGKQVNAGTVFVSGKHMELVRRWAKEDMEFTTPLVDQFALHRAVKQMKGTGVTGVHLEEIPLEVLSLGMDPQGTFAMHYNTASTCDKISYMKDNGDWRVADPQAGEYCFQHRAAPRRPIPTAPPARRADEMDNDDDDD